MSWTVLLICIALIALCFIGLGVQVFFSRKKKFPDTEVGHNRNMRARGLECAKAEEMRLHGGCRSCKETSCPIKH